MQSFACQDKEPDLKFIDRERYVSIRLVPLSHLLLLKLLMAVSKQTEGSCQLGGGQRRPGLATAHPGAAAHLCVPGSCDLTYSLIKNNNNAKDCRG